MNASGVVNLVGITSSISFTWLATFGRRQYSPPYTLCDALPSPGVNPLEGSPKCNCGKRDSEGVPGFQL